jgi:DNA-binding winged helix-turn-helix (wHTH) protein/Tol biopolymer transport system component
VVSELPRTVISEELRWACFISVVNCTAEEDYHKSVDTPSSPVRFGVFELDPRTGELRKKGLKVRLDGQPIQILAMLLERPGELLTQEEIRAKLWPDGTVVEFEHSIKTALRKLRQALGDDAESPRYIETLPRRGYRFIAPVDSGAVIGDPSPGLRPPSPSGRGAGGEGMAAERSSKVGAVREPPLQTQWGLRTAALLAMLVVGLALGWLVWNRSRSFPELKQKRLTSNSVEMPVLSGAISPDGKYVAYSDSGGLHLKLLETGEVRTLPRPSWFSSDALWNVAAWFPDGTQLLTNLFRPDGHSGVWAVSVMGENPHELRDDARAWAISPDGSRIAFTAGAPNYNREIWTMSTLGGDPQKVLATGENEFLWDVQWPSDGGRIAYGKGRQMPGGDEVTICTSDLKGGKPAVVVSDPLLWAFSWLPGGRLVHSRFDSAPLFLFIGECNLWEIPVDVRTGEPSGRPVQLTRWAGFRVDWLGSTVDGKRLAFLRRSPLARAYVGELEAGGTRMQPPRRLTFSEAHDLPYAWTPDSKAVIINSDRNGRYELFKQSLDREATQPLVTGSPGAVGAHLSPDGRWFLYEVLPRSEGTSTPIPLMRVPVGGGPSQLVLEARNAKDFKCARAPSTLCVVEERSPDNKVLTVTAFDPLKGRGRVLATIPTDPSVDYYATLSPDGAHFAFLKMGEAEGHLQLLALDGHPERDIRVKGWPGFTSLAWTPDAKGVYCGTMTPQGATLLHVDLDGNARVLWEQKGAIGFYGIWGEPSPDGRYLAIMTEMMDSNLWMLEGF